MDEAAPRRPAFTYLAIPYSSRLENETAAAMERDGRMAQFWRAAAFLIKRGDYVVSPMTLEPALRAAPDVPYDWRAWKTYSLLMMATCSRLVVLDLDGWTASEGVMGEIEEAVRLGLQVEHLDPARVDEELA